MEDKFDKTYTRFMDSAFDLLVELSETEVENLSDTELEFVNAFDEYLEEIDALMEEENKLN